MIYVQLNYDNVAGMSSPYYGEKVPHDEFVSMIIDMHRVIYTYADNVQAEELHISHSGGEFKSYHLSFLCDGLDEADFAKEMASVSKLGHQDAIAVIIGSTLVGPGSDDFPTTVKP